MAQVTNAEYQKVQDAMSNQFTADSINQYRTDYNNYLSQWMSSKDAFAKARNVLVEKTPSTPSNASSTPTPDYQNQWAWNYVYNEKTWYYEQTPSNTPTTQTPEVKQEVKQEETAGNTTPEIQQQGELKPLSQEYYNQTWDEAQSKIINNLNWYRQTNPELFSDYDTFKRNFSYDARNEEQKQTLDNWYNGYEKWMQLSSVPTTELYTQYKDGQVSVNDLENLRISNPTKYAELQNQINKGNIISAYDDDKWIDTTWMSLQDMAYQMAVQTFNKFMMWDGWSEASKYFADYKANMDSPEMLWLADQCTEIQEQMENIQSDLDSIKKQVEKEYEWTWASRSKINAIISDRSYELQLQLRTLNSEYNKYATQYNNRMNQYQNEFQMQLQEYQINQDARNQQMKELWFAMDLMNFETNEQKAQREWDYWVMQQEYTNWNINSKDYNTRYKAALNSVQNLLSQYEGIPMQRSAEQMAQDILTAIDNGSDLGAELTKINKQIQEKPEYKQIYNQTYGNGISWGIGKTYKIWDTEYVEYNGWLYTADQFNKMFGGANWLSWATWNAKAYNQVDERALNGNPMSTWYEGKTLYDFLNDSKNQKGKSGGQCGKFVNDYLQSIWMTDAANRYYDNELSTKLNSINTEVAKQWTIAVFDYNHISKSTWKNHWHVGIVTKVYPDWSFDVRDSNYGSDEKIQTRHISANDSALKWFFDPSQPPIDRAGSGWENNTQPTSVDRLTLTALRNWQIVNSKVPETIDQLVKAWFSEDEINEALNQNMEYYLPDDQRAEKNAILNSFRSNEIVKNFQSATEQFLWLSAAVNEANWAWDLASIYMFMRSQDPRSVVRENEFEAAAQTMWLWWEVQTWFTKLANWQRLTPEQRQNFIDVTVNVLESKKKAYKIVYDEAVNQMKAASIPSVYYPTDWATELDWIIAKLKWTTPQSTNQTTYQSTQSTTWTPSWATKYTNNTSTWAGSTVNINWNSYPSDFYSN